MADTRRRHAPVTTTYGSLAYDLDTLARERQLEEAGEMPQRETAPVRKPRVQSHPQVKTRPSALLVGSVMVLCALVVVLLMGYVQLTEVSTRVSNIRNEITDLESEHISLLTEYEKTFDLATVKSKAESAGMSKPSSGQIEYIDITGTDSAIVYGSEPSFVQKATISVKAGVTSVLEYFR